VPGPGYHTRGKISPRSAAKKKRRVSEDGRGGKGGNKDMLVFRFNGETAKNDRGVEEGLRIGPTQTAAPEGERPGVWV